MDILDFIERRMLLVHPRERATCGEVVEKLEQVTARVLDDEEYAMSPILGTSRWSATDLSSRSLSQSSYSDPNTMRTAFTEDHGLAEISERDAPKTLRGRAVHATAFQRYLTPAPLDFEQTPPNEILSGAVKEGGGISIRPSRGIDVESTSLDPGDVRNEPEIVQERQWLSIEGWIEQTLSSGQS